ncbi:MAG: DUF998 domain-containing protein [Candidatus Dormibacteraceae bacterium]
MGAALRDRRAASLAAGLVCLLELQYWVVQAIAERAWALPYSLRLNYISDLGSTACGPAVCSPLAPLMNASFVCSGALCVAAAVLLPAALAIGRWAGPAGVLLGLSGLGTAVVGLVPENVHLHPHTLAAMLAFYAGNAALCVLGLGMRRRRPATGWVTVALGVVGLLASLAFFGGHRLGVGVGAVERVAAWPLFVWLVVASGLLLGRRPQVSEERSG